VNTPGPAPAAALAKTAARETERIGVWIVQS